jgi:Domain of unknown function (DUF5615)
LIVPQISIYLDECVNNAVMPALAARGHIVVTTQSQGTNNYSDEEQIRFAATRGWVILTTNRKHFHRRHREFQQRGESHSGIITVPQDDHAFDRFSIRCAMMAAWVATAFTTGNSLFRWSDMQAMLHQGHLPAGFTADDIALALGAEEPIQSL